MYNEYMPSVKVVKIDEMRESFDSIKSEIKERLQEYLADIDSELA